MEWLYTFVLYLLQGMRLFLVLSVLLPMILPVGNALRDGIDRITEPILRPFRKFIKPIGGFDLSPLVLLLLMYLIEEVIRHLHGAMLLK